LTSLPSLPPHGKNCYVMIFMQGNLMWFPASPHTYSQTTPSPGQCCVYLPTDRYSVFLYRQPGRGKKWNYHLSHIESFANEKFGVIFKHPHPPPPTQHKPSRPPRSMGVWVVCVAAASGVRVCPRGSGVILLTTSAIRHQKIAGVFLDEGRQALLLPPYGSHCEDRANRLCAGIAP
jgi:hypothetical protein